MLVLLALLLALGGQGCSATSALEEVAGDLSEPQHMAAVLRFLDSAAWAGLEGEGAHQCRHSLQRLMTGILHKELWAIQMVDSWAKAPSGLLPGFTGNLGNFDECLQAELKSKFTGRYVILALEFQAPPLDNESDWVTMMSYQMGLCVPSTCSPAILRGVLENLLDTDQGKELLGKLDDIANGCVLAKMDSDPHVVESIKYFFPTWDVNANQSRAILTIPPGGTVTREGRRPASTADWLVGGLCVGLVLLALAATYFDITLADDCGAARVRASALLAFSLYTNGRLLLSVKAPGPDNISVVQGLRVISTCWIIFGHRHIWASLLPNDNFQNVTSWGRIPKILMVGSIFAVESFFTIGGIMCSYAVLTTAHRSGRFNVPLYLLHRVIRVTPPYMLVTAACCTWVYLLEDGPLWDEAASVAAGSCPDYWWTNLLYVSNYMPVTPCLLHTWYLSADMQLHWLAPLVLVPLWRAPRVGGLLLVLLTAGVVGLNFWLAFHFQLRGPFPYERMGNILQVGYYPTHMRASPYLVGLLAGFLLFKIKSGSLDIKLSKAQVACGWILSVAMIVAVTLVHHVFMDVRFPYSRLGSAAFIALHRPAWALAVSWVVLACNLGHGGAVTTFLSWGPFTVLGRLTFGIYLTHFPVQMVSNGISRIALPTEEFVLFQLAASDLVISSFLALILTLLTESPVLVLEKFLLRAERKRKSPETSTSGSEITVPHVLRPWHQKRAETTNEQSTP